MLKQPTFEMTHLDLAVEQSSLLLSTDQLHQSSQLSKEIFGKVLTRRWLNIQSLGSALCLGFYFLIWISLPISDVLKKPNF